MCTSRRIEVVCSQPAARHTIAGRSSVLAGLRRRIIECHALACGLVLSFSLGCDSPPPARDPENPTAYADLILTRLSPNEQIVEEVARLESQGLTLTATSRSHLGPGSPVEPTAEPAFREQFPAKTVLAIYQSTVQIYPPGEFVWKPRQLEVALQLRQANDDFLARFRRYLQRPAPDFGLDLRDGLLADTSLVEVVRAAHRLEALEAAVQLDRGQIEPALERLASMLAISARLDDLPHIVPRLAAAELRGEASYVVEALANHPAADASLRKRLATMITAQLTTWPEDSSVWIGDRAIALHAYEMVRDGQLLSLLTEVEIEALSQRGKLKQVAEGISKQVDADEAFYLSALRRLIEACAEPYALRQAAIAEVESKLDVLRDTPDYPYVAGDILLKHVGEANHRLVCDLALWRGLHVLLAEPGAGEGSAEVIDPLTDKPFAVTADANGRSIQLQLADNPARQLTMAP